MRTLITVAAALASLASSQAYGQFTINYKLELGGDNHADVYHNGGFQAYTRLPGGDANVTTPVAAGTVIYWAVVVEVTGTDPTYGTPSAGVANLVFDLELHKGAVDGPLVAIGHTSTPTTVGGFYSTINDGSTDFPGTPSERKNAELAAAFATAFDINSGLGNGGRLTDEANNGGPFMDFSTFPSTAGFPTGSTALEGTLVGMGAGYTQMAADTGHTVGVGIPYDANSFCSTLDIKAVCEGQISTAGFKGENVTYFLVLKAGAGNNVIPTDSGAFQVCSGVPGSFAIAATNVVTDDISFVVNGAQENPCTAPVLVAAKSYKTHGGAGEFGYNLMGGNAVEGRAGGVTKVVATFDKAVTLVGTSAVTVTAGSVVSATASGANVTIQLSGIPDVTKFTLAFPGVAADPAANNCVGTAASTSTLCAANLYADVNGDGVVNVNDLVFVRDNLYADADDTTFRGDVAVDGVLNVNDLVAARDNLYASVEVCQ